MREIGWFAIIAGAVALEVLTAPGTGLSGQAWKLSRSNAPGMVRFTVERTRPGSRSITTSDVPVANFRGFSLGMLDHSGPIHFEYPQDAGRLVCDGHISWGRAAGSFKLAANPEFGSGLNRLGYASPTEDELFSIIQSNVTLEFARTMQEAGVDASLRQLIDLRMRGITAEFIRDIHSAGYRNFRAQDYIDLQAHGVGAAFLRELKSAGYELNAGEIIDLRSHGVDTHLAAQLKQAGYDLSAGQITDLATHGVDTAYVRELKFRGLRPAASELVELRRNGVGPEYLRSLKEAGYGSLSTGEVIDLSRNGVPKEFPGQARELGYRFTPRELIDLRMHGVDTAYLKRLHDSGIQNLTEPQITQLRMHGVD